MITQYLLPDSADAAVAELQDAVVMAGGNLVIGGDVATALLALDAEVALSSRTVPVAEFWSSFRPGEEIVLSVSFEDDPAIVFLRHARRAANSPAVVAVAVSRGRVALGGVAPHPVLSVADPERAAAEIDPPSDAIASAWYRRRMTELFVRRALEASNAV
jgi:CO/xanthine dehydrogenase FAD-binding subunit